MYSTYLVTTLIITLKKNGTYTHLLLPSNESLTMIFFVYPPQVEPFNVTVFL